jgi:hypothetical protein
MKNLNHYRNDAFKFHEEVLKSKHTTNDNPTYKVRIENLKNFIKSQFDVYDKNFDQNTLESVVNYGYTEDEKSDLCKLYSYKNSVIQQLKIYLTTTAANRIISTCPNCTISEINSFDHYLPKERFPEFVVNPKNLFPSCTKCNSYKKDVWLKDGKRVFLNLYLDQLPSEQYLFVNLAVSGDVVTSRFFLQNTGAIDFDIFDIIETHYKNFHLLERFNENICEVVTSLENTINAFLNELALEKIIPIVVEKIKKR